MAATQTNGQLSGARGGNFFGSTLPVASKRFATWRASGLFRPLVSLIAVLLAMLGSAWAFVIGAIDILVLTVLESALTLLGAGVVGLCIYRMQRNLLQPLARLQQWATSMRGGDLSARIMVSEDSEFAPLAQDLSCLCEEFKRLKRDLDSQVSKQTERLAQKNASLKILYDVAASINHSRDLDDLLLRFLRILKEMVGAKAASVRLLQPDERLRLVGSIGLDDHVRGKDELLALQLCLCGSALSPGDILCQNDPRICSQHLGRPMYSSDRIEMVSVPLRYQGRTLGVYNLFMEKSGISGREDILELLTSIGNHLGMAVEKARLDEEARQMSIMEERTAFANELHDSLAQTLASLRFQVQVLRDIVGNDACDEARRQSLQIKNTLDEAHGELRELITQFRAPLDDRGLLPAVEALVERFRRDTGIKVFFQKEGAWTKLPLNLEMQVFRIVQESLNNVRKHSQAQLVRLMMRRARNGEHTILVEDDGTGFRAGRLNGHPEEHVGLSIMQERARRLGGTVRIESEPGEGTRIELRFWDPRQADA